MKAYIGKNGELTKSFSPFWFSVKKYKMKVNMTASAVL